MAAACGGATSDGSTAGGPVAIDRLPSSTADAYCDMWGPCCESQGIPVNQASCRNTWEQLIRSMIDEADPANYDYDATAAGSCLAAVRQSGASACDSFTSPGSGAEIACDSAFRGKLPPGEPCTSSIECAADPGDEASCEQGQDCTQNPDGTTDCTQSQGTCTVDHRASAGEDCYWTCTDHEDGSTLCFGSGGDEPAVRGRCFMNDGLYCSSAGTCAAQVGAGEACQTDDGCEGGLVCSFDTGLCEPEATEGQPCFSSDCADGLYCADGTCAPQLQAGSPCTDFDACLNGSCSSGTCEADASTSDTGLAFACALVSGGFPTAN
jgi:hypothetical protein